MQVTWRLRPIPLEPVAVAAWGPSAQAIAQRLLEREEEALAQLEGVVGGGVLIVRGATESLPWADGVLYLGQESAAPHLFLPTTLEPNLPIALLERALLQRIPPVTPPLVVLPQQGLLLSLSAARPIVRGTLRTWLQTP